jgi:hypothetical protein
MMSVETIVGLGYATFLVVVAWVLERTAEAAHRRADPHRLDGFVYREAIDAYECRGGALLPVVHITPDRKTARYRAPESICGTCALKQFCTGDEKSREIVRSSQPWIETEVGKFHRGLSLTLLVLSAVLIAGVLLLFEHTARESFLLAGAFVIVIGRTSFMLRGFRVESPSGAEWS